MWVVWIALPALITLHIFPLPTHPCTNHEMCHMHMCMCMCVWIRMYVACVGGRGQVGACCMSMVCPCHFYSNSVMLLIPPAAPGDAMLPCTALPNPRPPAQDTLCPVCLREPTQPHRAGCTMCAARHTPPVHSTPPSLLSLRRIRCSACPRPTTRSPSPPRCRCT